MIKKKLSAIVLSNSYATPYSSTADTQKYSCCCGKVHVLTVTKLIASICAILVICETVNMADTIAYRRYSSPLAIGAQVVSLLIGALVLVFMIAGLVLERSSLLVPFIASTAITIIFIACIDFFLLILLVGNFNKLVEKLLSDHTNEIIANEKNAGTHTIRAALALAVVIFSCALVLQMWQLRVVLQCYRYLRDVQSDRRINSIFGL
uniref:MARVEL domain-containing protein n=1 Tax=Ascaris lumbricoides TaxID=6252 RepID=A0A0M3I1R0_ASCLU